MPVIEFWESGHHPVTGFRLNYHDGNSRVRYTLVKYLKAAEFNPDDYIETKELMSRFNIGSNHLGKKIKELGFEKVTCLSKKWVSKEIIELLK